MRLKSIKLAGFKSFADATTIQFPSALTAIVGPNGCGKSNIVDALRWVIGESSAKQLRGEHLADVIFNGASGRKPMGKASIELLFDNTEARFGGEYASYQEIAIRREITRDGQSQFYLNGTRCRRRDVTDLFLGTGLGPHSYAIIEQGVISKLIEGKPEDIRIYLEEAAGTSKYRERRRDTENRLRHTRENLERLMDIRVEMEKQCEHLKRQASAAERYKTLKQEQRLKKAQLHALQCQALDKVCTEQQTLLETQVTELEEKIAASRDIDAQMEAHRVLHAERTTEYNTVQASYYEAGTEIAQQEQQIQHIQIQVRQCAEDFAQMESAWKEADQQLAEDRTQLEVITSAHQSLAPQAEQTAQEVETAQLALQEAEQTRAQSHQAWEQFQTKLHQLQRQSEVEATRLHHLVQKIQSITERLAQVDQRRKQVAQAALPGEITALSEQTADLKAQLDTVQNTLATLHQQIQLQQQTNKEQEAARQQYVHATHQLTNQKASLEALQQAALGKHNKDAVHWLQQQGWTEKPRLLEGLQVEKGWETAVETVLAPYLEAVCTDTRTDFQAVAQHFTKGRLALFLASAHIENTQRENTTESSAFLSSKVQSIYPIANLLQGIYSAENTEAALQKLPTLAAQESVITKEGLWFGANWMRVSTVQDEMHGVLQRKQALAEIEAAIVLAEQKLQAQEQICQQGQASLRAKEQERDTQQQGFRDLSLQHGELQARLSGKQAHIAQLQQQELALLQEEEKLRQQQQAAETEQETARVCSETCQTEKQQLEADAPALRASKEAIDARLQQLRQGLEAHKKAADACQAQLITTQSQQHYLTQNIQRAEKQLAQLQLRREAIEARQNNLQTPLPEAHTALQQLLETRTEIEKNLNIAKQACAQLEETGRAYEKERAQREKEIQSIRESVEKARIANTTTQTHLENQAAQIVEMGCELAVLLQEMPEEAEESAWQQALTQTENRIQRLGAINLAAIEEYQAIAERKAYLDEQDKDLREAIATLESAIAKIDMESRARLKETFEKANAQFTALFTRMFEGGHAALEWVGDEVLSAGVLIRAQPPGKRNTLLHLLSGGEKALTTIALVFSLFQLNPAPFCVLDEVDAPLDEANIGRFCRLVKSMSNSVQFLFISHNKSTMEIAQQMIGITMQEPGVSRLVSVDMEQALEMATA